MQIDAVSVHHHGQVTHICSQFWVSNFQMLYFYCISIVKLLLFYFGSRLLKSTYYWLCNSFNTHFAGRSYVWRTFHQKIKIFIVALLPKFSFTYRTFRISTVQKFKVIGYTGYIKCDVTCCQRCSFQKAISSK